MSLLANHFLPLFYGKKCLVVVSGGRSEPADGLGGQRTEARKQPETQKPSKIAENEGFCVPYDPEAAPNASADTPNEPEDGPYELEDGR